MTNKRDVVERYLHELCGDLDMIDKMHEQYPANTAEQEEIAQSVHWLINFVKYEPGTPEWENFEVEGWLWTTPTDGQVETIFPAADEYFMRLTADTGGEDDDLST